MTRAGETIFVAEPEGLIGSAIIRALDRRGLSDRVLPSSGLDLAEPGAVDTFFAQHRPDVVFLAAGKKGGILANQRFPAELMLDNLRVAANVLSAAHRTGVRKLLYLGSSCMYPRESSQPMSESTLMTGKLEPTSEPYSLAKLAGVVLCQAFRRQHGCPFVAAIPTNIYGARDDFDPDRAHVVGALIRRIHEAREKSLPEVVVWGTGRARREFLYADDLGDACLHLWQHYDADDPINIGYGDDLSIRELAECIGKRLGYRGALRFDATKPDGVPRKSLDCRRLTDLGWRASVPFGTGLALTCDWYETHVVPPTARTDAGAMSSRP